MKTNKKKLFIILAIIAIVILIAIIVTAIVLRKKEKSQIVYNDNGIESLNNTENNDENEVSNNIENVIENNEQAEENKIEETKPNIATTNTNTASPYYIKVNYQANTVTVYKKEANGSLTPIKAMICSCGGATPKSGVYKTSDKYEWGALIGGVYGRYSTRIVSDILFHSVPYTQNGNKGSIEYWEYDKLGTTASAGCVRLTLADAKWIFSNCPKGTEVEFYANSNPGPLGKPTAQKISDNTECRGWDPTDTAPESPWIAWNKKKAEQEKQKEEEKKKQEQAKNEISNTVVNNTTNKNVIKNEIKEENKNQISNTVQNNTVQSNTIQNTTNTVIQNKVTSGNKENN